MWKFKTRKQAIEMGRKLAQSNRYGFTEASPVNAAKFRSQWVLLSNLHPTHALGDHGYLYDVSYELNGSDFSDELNAIQNCGK